MVNKNTGYLSSLDRLQLDAASAAAAPAEWLDAHREDVLAVWKEKGTTPLAAILGLSQSCLRLWAKRRKLADGLWKARQRKQVQREANAGPKAPGDLALAPAATHEERKGDGYWQGQAEAYCHALELVCGQERGRTK